MFRLIIGILLTYQQIFSVDFIFFPIRTRTLMAVIGMYMLVRDWNSFRIPSGYSRILKNLLVAVGMIFSLAVVSSVINGVLDPYFFKFPIVLLISFASSYCFIKWLAYITGERLTMELLIKYFVMACLLQCVLSLLVFLFPPFRSFIFAIVPMNEMNEYAVNFNIHPTEDVLFRMIPVGYDFWGNGTTVAVIIFLMALLISFEKEQRKFFLQLLTLIFIIVIGASVSRTTLVGVPFFLLYMFMGNGERRNKRYILGMILMFIPIIILVYTWFLETYPIFESIFERAFSIIYIFKDTGDMQSVESMVGQSVIPTEFKTWLIGDGLMSDPLNPGTGFYKEVDIGVWRLVWGVGIFGLLLFSYIQYLYLRLARFDRLSVLCMFIIYCGFLYKGIFYYDLLMSPFIAMTLYRINYNNLETNESEE